MNSFFPLRHIQPPAGKVPSHGVVGGLGGRHRHRTTFWTDGVAVFFWKEAKKQWCRDPTRSMHNGPGSLGTYGDSGSSATGQCLGVAGLLVSLSSDSEGLSARRNSKTSYLHPNLPSTYVCCRRLNMCLILPARCALFDAGTTQQPRSQCDSRPCMFSAV